MGVIVTVVKLVRELHDGIGPARRRVAFIAEEIGAPQSCFTGKDLDAVTPKVLLDPFTVENDGLGRTSA